MLKMKETYLKVQYVNENICDFTPWFFYSTIINFQTELYPWKQQTRCTGNFLFGLNFAATFFLIKLINS
jgi:hypothetical protein